jgi:phosphatidylglycerophosphatase A
MTPDTESSGSVGQPRKKPQFSFLLATWFGLGYLPKAPGTWGSVGGLALLWVIVCVAPHVRFRNDSHFIVFWHFPAACSVALALVGVWVSSRVATYQKQKDPQFVVIDEVSGQLIALLLGAPAVTAWSYPSFTYAELLAGFLLFRLCDIWKPFPIRHLEKLPGGWGIMADDWLAGIYAAILLRLALHFNLL